MIRYARRIGWRTLTRVSVTSHATSASSNFKVNPSPISQSQESKNADEVAPPIKIFDDKETELSVKSVKFNDKKNSIVAAAFANLKSGIVNESTKKETLPIHERIMLADSVESLLSIAEESNIPLRHSLNIVSTLASWTKENRIKLKDFERDPRFLKLCKLLGREGPRNIKQSQQYAGFGDLAMVLGVTGDDEAAKLIAGISLSQMIKVLSTLASKRRRSTPLLRSLAFNINCCDEILDIKQGADVLYAMAVLNFPDDTLLERTCSNLCLGVVDNKKSAVVRSILTSLGHLRYRDTALLDSLSEWIVSNYATCRPQDVVALLMTLAIVSHIPSNSSQLFESIIPQFSSSDLSTPSAWVDFVWALVVLGQASASHLQSVLSLQFQDKLALTTSDSNGINTFIKRKLLNINAAAQLLSPNYNGPFLEKELNISQELMSRTREKQLFVTSMLDTLSNLLPSSVYLKIDVETGMGFLLDGECIIDSKLNPIPITDSKNLKNGKRIGILAWDYSAMCRATRPLPTGPAMLAVHLLEARGYSVLVVPYTEFNPQDKLITRVQYLEQQLKSLVKER